MAGTAVVGAGNYILEIDTGFIQDAFLLDDAVAGVLDNTTYVLDGTTNFADVTTGIDSITVKRGRRDIGDQFSAGTMTFNMLDTTGIFNPFDTLSPYYDPATAQPGLAPMRKVRLARYSSTNVKEDLFNGFIVNFDYNFALGGLDTVTVYCADDFYLLAQTFMAEFNVSEELSSVRLAAVLDLPEVDFPIGQRDISTGTQTLGGASAFTVAEGTNTLEYCNQINLAEQGRLFMARDGDITFQPRIGNTLSASVADFHDDGTNVPYDSIGITFEADQVVNRAAVAIRGGTQEVAEDLASQAKYFIQTTSITDSLLHDDPAALALANYLLEPEPEARYTSLGTNLNKLTTAQRDTVAIIDIGDTITLKNVCERCRHNATSTRVSRRGCRAYDHGQRRPFANVFYVANGHCLRVNT
jgi:hypothetical protein